MPAHVARRQAAALIALGSLALIASCREESSPRTAESKLASTAQSADLGLVGGAPRGVREKSARLESVVATAASAAPPIVPVSRPQVPGSSTLLIRNGDVSIQVDSVQRSIDAVRALAASLGGYVGNVSMMTGEHQVHSATLEMKVPAARFDDAMAGVKPLGEVERSNASAEDVGEEFVDVSARVANGKRLEQRLVTLLETRTGKLVDVLAIERELARVREEIERQEGRIRYLSARIAMSTIMVTVHEKAPLVATTPGTNAIRTAVIGMWRNMVHVVAFGIEFLGVLIPPAILAGLLWIFWRRSRRRPPESLQPSV